MTAENEEIAEIRQRLKVLDQEREHLSARLRELERAQHQSVSPATSILPGVTNSSSAADKIALFRRLFSGRTDVFPVRWQNPKSGRSGYAPACANEWVRGICGKPKVKCGDCEQQSFIPVSDKMIEYHLRGEDRIRPNGRGGAFVAGVYPMLFDDTCTFLAVDFDNDNWSDDACAFLATCHELDLPAALERSRSGNGGHVWIFFAEPVAASDIPMLARMALKRQSGYRSLGYEIAAE